MSEQEFLTRLTNVLNSEDELAMDMDLDDVLRWDSLGMVSFAGMCVEDLRKNIGLADISNAETVRDLYNLILEKN